MKKKISTSPEKRIQHIKIAREITKDRLHQKFIEASLELDVSILEPFIPEDMELQDLDKYRFLASLKDHFDSIWQQHPEEWRVELADLTCGFCNRGKPLAGFAVYAGCEFIPYEKFGFFIEEDEKGITKDIYICKLFR